jgi:two-component system chemotaxis response regulator CheY
MRALVADDDRGTTAILSKTIRGLGMEVTSVHDGTAAWECLSDGPAAALVVVDWMMPGLDGPEICRRIRAHPTFVQTYVILLTGRRSREDIVTGLDAGADDYIVKPFDLEELRARLHVGLRVATLQQELNKQICELQRARDELSRVVSTDALTGLSSRRHWFDVASREFIRSRRYRRPLGLLVADLDYFKRVNDTYGHEAGDAVLKEFADVLQRHCRQSDTAGRLGGEEFALLLPEGGIPAAREVARRVVEHWRTIAVTVAGGTISCTCSIGVAEALPDDETIEAVLARADQALYTAKRDGRDRWR